VLLVLVVLIAALCKRGIEADRQHESQPEYESKRIPHDCLLRCSMHAGEHFTQCSPASVTPPKI
jgi:hypothetical protein